LRGKKSLPEKKSKGSLFIVSAPSGAGKTTLCRKLVSGLGNLTFSVSYTTRCARPDEVNDRDYTFVKREDFLRMADEGEFIEWAEVHGELYGTSGRRVRELLDRGDDVVLDIDTQGARQIRKKYDGGVYIFILPPSLEELRKRLRERMTDSSEEIGRRLGRAIIEIKTFREYDYVIINDVLEDALREFESVIISHRVRTELIDPLWIEKVFLQEEEN
jgi:guanylate kinase